jgi:hypothetical protein
VGTQRAAEAERLRADNERLRQEQAENLRQENERLKREQAERDEQERVRRLQEEQDRLREENRRMQVCSVCCLLSSPRSLEAYHHPGRLCAPFSGWLLWCRLMLLHCCKMAAALPCVLPLLRGFVAWPWISAGGLLASPVSVPCCLSDSREHPAHAGGGGGATEAARGGQQRGGHAHTRRQPARAARGRRAGGPSRCPVTLPCPTPPTKPTPPLQRK